MAVVNSGVLHLEPGHSFQDTALHRNHANIRPHDDPGRRGGAQRRREGEGSHDFDGARCLGSCGPALDAKLRDSLRSRVVKLLLDLAYVYGA